MFFAVVLALGGLGAWYAASSIDPIQLTKLLSSTVKASTGRDLRISGPVRLSIFPSIGVKAEQVSLSNASWASDSQMLSVKQIELDVKLFPLFAKRVEVSKINLAGLELHLQTNQTGLGNWDLTPPASTATKSGSTTSDRLASADEESNLVGIESIQITDAHITYQSGTSPKKVITIPQLSIKGEGSKTAVSLDLQYADYKLGLKGKTSSLRQAIMDWDQSPVNMNLDLIFNLNGKSCLLYTSPSPRDS